MRKAIRILRPWALATALSVGGIGLACAQGVGVPWDPRTGDAWVDTWLGDMNQYGSRYQPAFTDEMNRYYGVPRPYVGELLGQRGWAPGDVYMACAIAQLLGRPCSYVVDQYAAYEREQPGQGWGATAQRLGIQPGSPQFHRLKSGMVRSYDRWERPIVIDQDLVRDFPGRDPGKAAPAARTQGKAAPGNGARGDAGKPKAAPLPGGDKARGAPGQRGNGTGKGKEGGPAGR